MICVHYVRRKAAFRGMEKADKGVYFSAIKDVISVMVLWKSCVEAWLISFHKFVHNYFFIQA